MRWRKHIETILILFAVFTVVLLGTNVSFSDRLIVVSIATLAMYYLMSGTLVLFDSRVTRPMRILYFVGLWSICIGLLGIIFRLRFWINSELVLMVASGLSVGTLVVVLLMRQMAGGDQSQYTREQLKPLFTRLLIYPLFFIVFLSVPNRELYRSLGPNRDNPEYIERFIESIENPEDSVIQQQFQEYQDSINQLP